MAYRVFDWEVNDNVLIIHHLPRTQAHHISVLDWLWAKPCRERREKLHTNLVILCLDLLHFFRFSLSNVDLHHCYNNEYTVWARDCSFFIPDGFSSLQKRCRTDCNKLEMEVKETQQFIMDGLKQTNNLVCVCKYWQKYSDTALFHYNLEYIKMICKEFIALL